MKSKILLGVLVLTLTGCRFFTTKEVVEYRIVEPATIIVSYLPVRGVNRDLERLRIEHQDENIFDARDIDVAPSFPGGAEAMSEFISQNKQYPWLFYEQWIQGTVVIIAIIEKDGTIFGAEAVRSPDPIFSREALRIVSLMPKWIPGKQNGEVVRTFVVIPIRFLHH